MEMEMDDSRPFGSIRETPGRQESTHTMGRSWQEKHMQCCVHLKNTPTSTCVQHGSGKPSVCEGK